VGSDSQEAGPPVVSGGLAASWAIKERTYMETVESITSYNVRRDASSSGVSWGAVIGGAFVAAALSLIMLALGAGFGLSAVSPWSGAGVSASTVGSVAIVWLIVTQLIAFSMGGYLAGRLRTRWSSIHNDEVHFRDTANGFLAWAVAVVMTVAFLTAAASSMANSRDTSARAGTAEDRAGLEVNAYFVDRLFRSDHPATTANDMPLRAEASRIFAKSIAASGGSAADTAYLAQLVAAKTGLNSSDAAKRVSDTLTDARQSEDDARKAAAHLLLWVFLALLIGAFCASLAATIGGKQRDRVQVI
jgi:hypothetical protein